MGGELIARAIVDGDQTWRLFPPFELVWAGGRLGRAAQQAYYWSFRMREKLDGWLARQREAKRRGAEPKPADAPPRPAVQPRRCAERCRRAGQVVEIGSADPPVAEPPEVPARAAAGGAGGPPRRSARRERRPAKKSVAAA